MDCSKCLYNPVCALWREAESQDAESYLTGGVTDGCPIFKHTVDVAEVVRCKDCRFCHYNAESGLYHCRRRGYFSEEVQEDDFCSYGERSEE